MLRSSTSAFVGFDKIEYNAFATHIRALVKTTVSIVLVLVGFGILGAVAGYVAGFVASKSCCCLSILSFKLFKPLVLEEDINFRKRARFAQNSQMKQSKVR